jgi:DNA-binding transcriptional MerR regulator
MTEGPGAKGAPHPFANHERAPGQDVFGLGEREHRAILVWVGENLPQVRRSVYEQRLLCWSLGSAWWLPGCACRWISAQIIGNDEPFGLVADLRGRRAGRRELEHMITIGQLAAYAGVTIKAIRHYHQRGLLAEPPRDSSGYRRYSAEHATDMVKIKTLAEAGVPLARVKELLAADPDRFAAAIAEIDRTLQQRADQLQRTRERIARLSAGDRLFVSEEVAEFLERLRGLGVSQRSVQMERDGWILLQAVSPKEAAIWIADKRDAINDPEFRAIYLESDAAFGWSPDDPRLDALANRAQRWLAKQRGRYEEGQRRLPDPAIVQLISTSVDASSPAWSRLTEIAKQDKAGG